MSALRGRAGAAAVAVALLVLALAAWLLTRPAPAPGAEGVAGRVQVQGLDTGTHTLDGGCFKSSRLQATGRDDRGQEQFVLTLTLRSDPATVGDLVSRLAEAACIRGVAEETQAAASRVKDRRDFGGLSTEYRTAAGVRVRLP
ncbi:MAG: hypothetical protein ABR598_07245 [Candidatus Dormibacteria bacterium]